MPALQPSGTKTSSLGSGQPTVLTEAGAVWEGGRSAASAALHSIPPAGKLALSEPAGSLLPWKRSRAVWFEFGHLISLLLHSDSPRLSPKGLAPGPTCTPSAIRTPVGARARC